MSEAAIRAFRDGDLERVVALWRAAELVVPHNNPEADITLCRGSGHGEVLVAEHGGALVATVMVGHDGHRGWVYYVAVDPRQRNQGWGRRVMAAAERWLAQRGVRKLELMIRNSNAGVRAFYAHLGYGDEPVVVMSRWLDGTRVPGAAP